jgi:ABC-2 type transport system permease protein
MNKILTVILREFLVVVRKKTFIVATILTPLLLGGIMGLQAWLASREERQTFAVVDRSGLNIPLELSLKRNNLLNIIKGDKPWIFNRVEDEPKEIEKILEQVKEKEKKADLTALIIIDKDVALNGKVEYHARSITDGQTQGWLRENLNQILVQKRLQAHDLSRRDISRVTASVDLELIDVTGKREGAVQRTIIGFASFFLLYMMITLYGSMIMNGFIEDKSSRVMEVLLSSISARQILLGKVIGIGLTCLTQIGIWVLLLIAAARFKPAWFFILTTAPKSAFAFTILYFLLGYSIYSLVLSAVGAMCTSTRDAQQLSLPVFMPILLSMAMMPAVMREPDGVISLVLSLIPLTSPIVMPAMMGLAKLPTWQIAASISILILSIPIVYVGASKLFRLSILNQGRAPNFSQIFKMLRSSEK